MTKLATIEDIIHRGKRMGLHLDNIKKEEVQAAADKYGIDLDKWLKADHYTFFYDFLGIREEIKGKKYKFSPWLATKEPFVKT